MKVNELKKVDHPNIIKLISYGKWRDKLDVFNCIIIEYADVGSLHHGWLKHGFNNIQ
jgi:serine/threonine protein kinase